ncbi:MAG: hypothetical protein K0U29_03790 [Gammaproteobacteria bacterium]|nr:hypothetical protein [Gammaproteobacteria bacterium]
MTKGAGSADRDKSRSGFQAIIASKRMPAGATSQPGAAGAVTPAIPIGAVQSVVPPAPVAGPATQSAVAPTVPPLTQAALDAARVQAAQQAARAQTLAARQAARAQAARLRATQQVPASSRLVLGLRDGFKMLVPSVLHQSADSALDVLIAQVYREARAAMQAATVPVPQVASTPAALAIKLADLLEMRQDCLRQLAFQNHVQQKYPLMSIMAALITVERDFRRDRQRRGMTLKDYQSLCELLRTNMDSYFNAKDGAKHRILKCMKYKGNTWFKNERREILTILKQDVEIAKYPEIIQFIQAGLQSIAQPPVPRAQSAPHPALAPSAGGVVAGGAGSAPSYPGMFGGGVGGNRGKHKSTSAAAGQAKRLRWDGNDPDDELIRRPTSSGKGP